MTGKWVPGRSLNREEEPPLSVHIFRGIFSASWTSIPCKGIQSQRFTECAQQSSKSTFQLINILKNDYDKFLNLLKAPEQTTMLKI